MTDAAPMEQLRRRRSEKWTTHPPDVLPMFIAEMDFPLAPAITAALQQALADGDTGYVNPHDTGAAEAYAAYARDAWDWEIDPSRTSCTTDVSVVVVESLRRLTAPGDGVVVTSPVYPPFFDLVVEAGGTVVDVPLLDDGREYRLDLEGVDRALAAGARAVLLCNPHNPVGRVHSREELTELSRVVARHGAAVVSDEIHAPLTHRGVEFTPYLTVSEEARDHGIAACSGSKAFNLAGLKTALFVTASDRTTRIVRSLPEEVVFRTGHFGALATRAGFTDGLDWLDATLATIEGNVDLLRRELAAHLPQARLRTPSASYLAWLDLRELGWGDDPARHALEHGRVALSNGPAFGPGGAGFARVNLACAPDTVREAVARLVRAREVPAGS
ncbi:MalY/PatB family protein [Kineococcus sp. SYSU DK001]|uniref:MalY/PatB family protein n=1 Tax=Kineococcus sp. SYSU DK001 TaxID=3383122 RepID=UPI003D7CAB3D